MPGWRDQLTQRVPMGSVIKFHALYDEPFWRHEGLSGFAVSDSGPVSAVYDTSPEAGSPGVLVGFIEGEHARAWARRDPADRRRAMLALLTDCFDGRAGHEVLGWSVPHSLGGLACAEARLGDLDDAEAHLREAATLLLASPQPATAAMVMVGAALVAAGRDRPELAARLLGAADATRERIGVLPVGAERVEADLAREAVAARLKEPALAAALAAGRDLGTEQALRAVLG
jgi:Flavin containing amine oxidoreductase